MSKFIPLLDVDCKQITLKPSPMTGITWDVMYGTDAFGIFIDGVTIRPSAINFGEKWSQQLEIRFTTQDDQLEEKKEKLDEINERIKEALLEKGPGKEDADIWKMRVQKYKFYQCKEWNGKTYPPSIDAVGFSYKGGRMKCYDVDNKPTNFETIGNLEEEQKKRTKDGKPFVTRQGVNFNADVHVQFANITEKFNSGFKVCFVKSNKKELFVDPYEEKSEDNSTPSTYDQDLEVTKGTQSIKDLTKKMAENDKKGKHGVKRKAENELSKPLAMKKPKLLHSGGAK